MAKAEWILMNQTLNMQFLGRSNLREGDIFAILPNDGKYVFGRLIKRDVSFGRSPFGGSNLVYIYKERSKSTEVDVKLLSPDSLMLPPLYVSKALWTSGFAVRVMKSEVTSNDLLKQHCFEDRRRTLIKYFDENGNELPMKTEPCGEWRYITSMIHFDNILSDALNIKRMPLVKEDMYYFSGKGEKILIKQPRDDLKKYSNYKWIIENHPEIVE